MPPKQATKAKYYHAMLGAHSTSVLKAEFVSSYQSDQNFDMSSWLQIHKHAPSATFALIFHGICGTYFVTAGHLLKRIFVTNLLEICTHIPGLCKCVHTEGYCMQTSTKYPPIYPPLTMYSQEGCLVHTYSKYSPTYTYCVLCRIIEHLLQMS